MHYGKTKTIINARNIGQFTEQEQGGDNNVRYMRKAQEAKVTRLRPGNIAVASLLIIMIFAFGGCTVPESAPQEKQAAAANLKQLAKNFHEFNKESYEAALNEGKYVFLDFYANWCPICKAEEPDIKAAFNELSTGNVVGFRVNYNDDQTDENEKALAKKLGVAYQHTKIVVAPDEKVVSRTLRQQSKQEVLDQINSGKAG